MTRTTRSRGSGGSPRGAARGGTLRATEGRRAYPRPRSFDRLPGADTLFDHQPCHRSTGADLERAEHVSQVEIDGVAGEEHLLRDPAIGPAVGDEMGDLAFG